MPKSKRFWETTALNDMSREQWESLCDGCGKCCLHKIENIDTGQVYVCNVACKLLNLDTCRCSDYAHRQQRVPDCTVLSPARVDEFKWLPSTCAYRLIAEHQPLPDWHPLISGDTNSVHAAGISVRGRVISESDADDITAHITDWVL